MHFGKYHDVDSSEAALRSRRVSAFVRSFKQPKPSLLEPIIQLQILCPTDKIGDIHGDLSTRRGRVLGMESAGGNMQTVSALVPLSEVSTYSRSLSSITGGQGSYVLQFDHYDVVPGNIQRQVMEAVVLHEEEE